MTTEKYINTINNFQGEGAQIDFTATYSPEDNKLRLTAAERLPKELYERVRAAGFIWAPHQKIFVTPKWTPDREDLCLELAGEIGDEDTSLVDRAEERAERFEDYGESRLRDAERSKDAVDRISGGIPFGQPILIGHHSERHARRDARLIEGGLKRAVKMWETSEYWKHRAAGALAHARYKESTEVRARRIKTIEAEKRALIAEFTPHDGVRPVMQTPSNFKNTKPYGTPEYEAEEKAAKVPYVLVGPKGRGTYLVKESSLENIKARNLRSIAHCDNRLVYERAMLGEQGGLASDKFDIQVGGRVQTSRGSYVVSAVNKGAEGRIVSVSTIGSGVVQIEHVQAYFEAEENAAEKVKESKKLPPLVNYRAPGCVEMTSDEWKRCTRASDSYFVAAYTLEGKYAGFSKRGAYRQRSTLARGGVNYHDRIPIFLTDAKVAMPPKEVQAPVSAEILEDLKPIATQPEPRITVTFPEKERSEFEDIKATLKAGIKVMSAPQLFPTPMAIARRMVELSGVRAGDTVLEPSAGSGSIVQAVIDAVDTEIVGYEINQDLVSGLSRKFPSYKLVARRADFLEVTEGQGQFSIVLMNPPFADAVDIRHIMHARTFLRPGGTLVALCANGPRQRAALMDHCEHWEDLPAGSFSDVGTNVNVALLVMGFTPLNVPKTA